VRYNDAIETEEQLTRETEYGNYMEIFPSAIHSILQNFNPITNLFAIFAVTQIINKTRILTRQTMIM